jgi:hypothetical protein
VGIDVEVLRRQPYPSIGAGLNSKVEHQTARNSTTGAPRPLGDPGAEMADHVAIIGPGSLFSR